MVHVKFVEVPFPVVPLPFLGRLFACPVLWQMFYPSCMNACCQQVANFAGSQFIACRIQWSGPFAHEDFLSFGAATTNTKLASCLPGKFRDQFPLASQMESGQLHCF